jgi:hypothetical protein
MAVDLAYRLRALTTENLNLKLLSLGFALALFGWVHGSQEAQRSLLLSVVALTPADSSTRELVTAIPAQIRVTVRGARSTLDDLHADDIGSVQIDLRNGSVNRFTFEPSMVPVPPGITVEQIDPPELDLTWEDRIQRDVPVEVGIVGTPASGFVVKGTPTSDPGNVRARGPKSEVMVVQRARADAFDVTGLTAGKYTRQLAIERAPGRLVFDATSVSAAVEIGREEVERAFTRVPIALLGRAGAKAQPAEVDVRLDGPPEVIRALRPEQLVPRVLVSSPAEHGSDAVPVELTVDQCQVHLTPPNVIVRW